MIPTRFILAFATLLVLGQPSLACRGPFGHQYVFLEVPPSRLPSGAVLLVLSFSPDALVGGMGEVPPVDARIVAAKDKRLIGQNVSIRPGIFSSCGRWAESDRASYVVGVLEREAKRLTLVPITYRSKQYRTADEDNSVGINAKQYRTGR
jgi:hypothetical protein